MYHGTPQRRIRSIAVASFAMVLACAAHTAVAAPGTVLEAARADEASGGRLHSWIAAVQSEPGLRDTLGGSGKFTLFAPDDRAFAELMELEACGAVQLNQQLISTLLNYHVVRGAEASLPIGEPVRLKTRLGAPLSVASDEILDGTDDAAHVRRPAIHADNGVVHVIDKVLWPFPAPRCS